MLQVIHRLICVAVETIPEALIWDQLIGVVIGRADRRRLEGDLVVGVLVLLGHRGIAGLHGARGIAVGPPSTVLPSGLVQGVNVQLV